MRSLCLWVGVRLFPESRLLWATATPPALILGGILALASVRATAWQGAYLLAIYCIGLGLPFLIIGAAFDFIMPLVKRVQRYSGLIHIVSGFLLIVIGVLILTNNLTWFYSLAA